MRLGKWWGRDTLYSSPREGQQRIPRRATQSGGRGVAANDPTATEGPEPCEGNEGKPARPIPVPPVIVA